MKETILFIMPFGTKEGINFDENFKRWKQEEIFNDYNVYRVDSLADLSISKKMYKSILAADIVIADLTLMNPNVLYELGYRHGWINKKTILIKKKNGTVDTIPFDLKDIVIFDYEHNLTEIIDGALSSKGIDSAIRNNIDSLPELSESQRYEFKKAFDHWENKWAGILEKLSDFRNKKQFAKGLKFINEEIGIFNKHEEILYYKALFTYKASDENLSSLLEAKEILEPLTPLEIYRYETSTLYISIVNKIHLIQPNKNKISEIWKYAYIQVLKAPNDYSISQFYIASIIKLINNISQREDFEAELRVIKEQKNSLNYELRSGYWFQGTLELLESHNENHEFKREIDEVSLATAKKVRAKFKEWKKRG